MSPRHGLSATPATASASHRWTAGRTSAIPTSRGRSRGTRTRPRPTSIGPWPSIRIPWLPTCSPDSRSRPRRVPGTWTRASRRRRIPSPGTSPFPSTVIPTTSRGSRARAGSSISGSTRTTRCGRATTANTSPCSSRIPPYPAYMTRSVSISMTTSTSETTNPPMSPRRKSGWTRTRTAWRTSPEDSCTSSGTGRTRFPTAP